MNVNYTSVQNPNSKNRYVFLTESSLNETKQMLPTIVINHQV